MSDRKLKLVPIRVCGRCGIPVKRNQRNLYVCEEHGDLYKDETHCQMEPWNSPEESAPETEGE